ncbi:MAG: acyl-CoA dehydrogenase family protein [Wenzhouxiangellaceae bacterium]
MSELSFIQPAPELGNQYRDDWFLSAWLQTELPSDLYRAEAPVLDELGDRAGHEWFRMQQAEREVEPKLVQWDPWGRRIDLISLTPMWQQARHWAAEYGLVAAGYDTALGAYARTIQFARAWLFVPSTDFYGCPLAMTDGAVKVLMQAANRVPAERALPHLLARDGEQFWTSGQWMTETVGGSDVSRTETVARQTADGQWQLTGRKWFTSAINSEMALTLARPEGNPSGSRGLALFYVETRGADGRLNGIEVLRLKDKLGTRKLPTAELFLNATPAEAVGELANGVAAIAPMLNLTRTWNAVTACSLMRRGLALAWSYAGRRRAFGELLEALPLHRRTLELADADFALASAATWAMIRELGRVEHDHPEADPALVRMLTPVVKLGTAKDAVAVTSEVLESFGGAGYIEDTGLPVLLRDVQVLPIWEGTTNVLALDLIRAVDRAGLKPWTGWVERTLERAAPQLPEQGLSAVRRSVASLCSSFDRSPGQLEASARHLALQLYRTTGLVELLALSARCAECEHASLATLKRVMHDVLEYRFRA